MDEPAGGVQQNKAVIGRDGALDFATHPSHSWENLLAALGLRQAANAKSLQ
jgi:hypothetical protein